MAISTFQKIKWNFLSLAKSEIGEMAAASLYVWRKRKETELWILTLALSFIVSVTSFLVLQSQ